MVVTSNIWPDTVIHHTLKVSKSKKKKIKLWMNSWWWQLRSTLCIISLFNANLLHFLWIRSISHKTNQNCAKFCDTIFIKIKVIQKNLHLCWNESANEDHKFMIKGNIWSHLFLGENGYHLCYRFPLIIYVSVTGS